MLDLGHLFMPDTVMYGIVRSTALSAVFLHAMLGCRLHHAHGHDSSPGIEPSVVGNPSGCPCHGQKQSGRPIDNRRQRDECDSDRCVFILLKSADVFEPPMGQDCPTLVFAVRRGVGPNGAADVASGHVPTAIPLHLLIQALLL